MKLRETSRKVLLGVTTIACGILGFVLFRWTPNTGNGLLLYVLLFAVLVIIAIVVSSRKREDIGPAGPRIIELSTATTGPPARYC